MVKLAVFDVDGTLVSRGERVLLQSTIDALKELQKQGVTLAIASGRPPFAMEKLLLDNVSFDYFICSNGACVKRTDGTILYRFEYTHEEINKLVKLIKDTDNAMMFQCEDGAYCYHGYKRIADMLQGFLGRLDFLLDKRHIKQQHEFMTLPLAAVAKIENKDIKNFKTVFPQFNFTPFDELYYDINGKEHNKATGISHICEELGCTMEEAAAFGDGMNDYEMLQEAGFGIAMGDANDSVKAAADYITTNSDEDGIANACKHFGWIK